MQTVGIVKHEGPASAKASAWQAKDKTAKWHTLPATFALIKFSHTIFALPFALGAMLVAAGGWPGWRLCTLILAAMVTARSAAMAFNRLVDVRFDAKNPRTCTRPSVTGAVSRRFLVLFTLGMAAAFLLITRAINPLAFALAPIALLVLCGYSLTKRFTNWTHLFLGAALGLSPLAAEIAVRGALSLPFIALGAAVACWVAGFDILYALQDRDFDRATGLHSVPARFGIPRALWISRALHALAATGFMGFGALAVLGAGYFVCAGGMALALVIEHAIVGPGRLDRLNAAFFTANGWVSVLFLVGILSGSWV